MKAIILAAGRGARLRPLTDNVPKPLVAVKGRPILDYVFDVLPDQITEVIVVVKYRAEQIKEYLGKEYRGRKVHYVNSRDEGTAYSFLAARDLIESGERFLLLYGDEL